MAQFPVHPDAVTPAWLSEILGRKVTGVRWEPIGTGQVGDSVRFHLEGVGVPATLAGKFPAEDAASRNTAVMFGLYRKEVEFYRHAASVLDVRVPRVVFAEAIEDGSEYILLFEDLGPARQGNQIAGCNLSDARAALAEAAAIHAPSWGNARLLEASWIQPPPDLGSRVAAMYPQAQAVFRERYASSLEPEFMAVCDQLADASSIYFATRADKQCLVHGDFRLDNMLFDILAGAEPVAILDWQTVTTGKAMHDVGYFLGCGLGQLGLDREEDLLAFYLSEMDGRGVTLSRDGIHEDYRRGILHGVSTAVFSAAFVERTQRGDDNFLSMARGACALALRHDSIGVLKERG